MRCIIVSGSLEICVQWLEPLKPSFVVGKGCVIGVTYLDV